MKKLFTASPLGKCFDPFAAEDSIMQQLFHVCFIHSVSLKLPLVSHNFFWMIKTTSSSSSAVATASQCKAVKYFFTKSTIGCLSRKIIKPVGLSMRSISINRSSGLQSFFATSDKTLHAWSKS